MRWICGTFVKRAAVLVFLVVILSGCDNWVITYDSTDPSVFLSGKITSDGSDEYTFTGTNGSVDIRPLATNTGGNTREAFWPTDGPDETDEQTCAEWGAASGDFTQQGAAL